MKSKVNKDFDKPKSEGQKAPQHIMEVLAQMPIYTTIRKYMSVLDLCGTQQAQSFLCYNLLNSQE